MLYYCEWQRKKNTNMSKVREVNFASVCGFFSVADPRHFGVDPDRDPGSDPDLRIHASDYWIRIQIRILLFSSLTFKTPRNNYIFKRFFCLLLFEDAFTSCFKDKKSKRSHKTVGIKVFLLFLLG
jgi:hypothetical protein